MKKFSILGWPIGALAFIVLAVALQGCKDKRPPAVACTYPADGEYVARGGTMKLRLPSYVNTKMTYDCKQLKHLSTEFLWYDGKLLPERANRFNVPSDKYVMIRISADHLDAPFDLVKPPHGRPAIEPWRFDPAIAHQKYPMVFYPRWFWKEEHLQPIDAPPDTFWGIENTNDPITGRRFGAFCDIDRADPSTQASVVRGDFSKNNPAAGCRGGVTAVNGEKIIAVMIDVPASGVPEIGNIYNAVQKELTTYIDSRE